MALIPELGRGGGGGQGTEGASAEVLLWVRGMRDFECRVLNQVPVLEEAVSV